MLITFVTLGKYLEAYAKGKTASALQKLMELQPVVATQCHTPKESLITIESKDGTNTKIEKLVDGQSLENG